MTYQDVLDALDSILEKLRGNNSELCEKLGIEPDDPSITGEEDSDGEEEGGDVEGGEEQSAGDDGASADADATDAIASASEEDEEKVSEETTEPTVGPTAAEDKPVAPVATPSNDNKGFSEKIKDGFNQAGAAAKSGFQKAKNWAAENPKTALAAAAGTGLAAGLLASAMSDDEEEDESTSVSESKEDVDIFEADNAETVEAPKADEPKAETPKADEPKAEAPKADEPKVDEPKAAEQKDEAPKADEPKAEEKPEAKAEEKKSEEKPAAKKGEEPKEEKKDDSKSDDSEKEGFVKKHKGAIAAGLAGLAAGGTVGGVVGANVGKKKERKRVEVGTAESTEVSEDDKTLNLNVSPLKDGMSSETSDAIDSVVDASVKIDGKEPPAEDADVGGEKGGILDAVSGIGKDAVKSSENIMSSAQSIERGAGDIKAALDKFGGDINQAADSLGMTADEIKAAIEKLDKTGAQLGSDFKTGVLGGAAIVGGSMLGSALLKRRRRGR